MIGGGWSGGFGGGRGSAASPGGGLPFAGVPPEMQAGVDGLLATEPEHPEPDVSFSFRAGEQDRRKLGLWRLVSHYWYLGVLALLLVTVVSVANQAGPELISYAIDHGMLHPDMAVVAVTATLYVLAIAVTALAQRAVVQVTGRLAASVMYELRVRVFSHLQRLGLDYYTDEKAGVIMSRMTSDVENLQRLLQDGLAQFVVQGLTMVVIAAVLFVTNPLLALITVAIVVPVLTGSSIWFQRASAHGYLRVRDGIANVLADLSESLHGVRVVTAYNRQAANVVHHRNVVGAYR
ncbi:MAG: ABC transporter ATP-binding protein, partial [Acidimicrobiales bacterium]